MRHLFLIVVLLAAPVAALSAPFIVSDPLDPVVTHCGWKTDSATRVDVPVALSGTSKICKLDLAGLAVGSHTVSATAVAIDAIWGRRESVPSPNFTFSVPSVPAVPPGLRLIP